MTDGRMDEQTDIGDCIVKIINFYFSDFSSTIPRPFGVRYNPYTQSIEILDSKRQIQKLITDINYEIRNLIDAFNKF